MANSPITPVKVNYATGDVLTAQNLDDEASAINRIAGYATQATANSTKTLVLADLQLQEFTGTTAGQVVVMPVVTTLGLGMSWIISNKSTQTIAVQSSGANAIITVPAATDVRLTCVLITGTTAASWQTSYVGFTTSPAATTTAFGVSCYNSAALSTTQNTDTILGFNSENFDTSSYHDTVTNNSRITIPSGKDGKYLVTVTGSNLTTSTFFYFRLYKNGVNWTTGIASGTIAGTRNTGGLQSSASGSYIISLAATDYIEIAANTDATTGNNANNVTFSAMLLGA